MTFNIVCFKSTGFNLIDIPYNADIITNNFDPHSFEAVWLLQNKGLAEIRIKATWDEIDGADYCVVQRPGVDVWYFISKIEMLNENCCKLSLNMDAITTIGLNRLHQITGWCSRRHVKDDELMKYTLPEPWVPSTELILEPLSKISLDPETTVSDTTFIGCTFNLAGEFRDADFYITPEPDPNTQEYPSVVVPNCPGYEGGKNKDTRITMVYPDNTSNFNRIPATRLFELSAVADNINKARSLSLDTGIVASYKIPGEYHNPTASEPDGYDRIANRAGYVASTLVYEYAKNVINKKVFASFNTYTLLSICSGDSKEFQADEIYHPGDKAPRIAVWADLSPEGNPFFRPEYYLNNNTDFFMNCIQGSPWQNTPIAFATQSGSKFAIKELGSQNLQQITNMGLGSAQAALAGASAANPLTMSEGIDSAFEGARIATDAAFQWARNQRAFEQSQVWVTPEIVFPLAHSIQNFIGNCAYLAQKHLSPNDVKRFDRFLSMYGYAVDEPLTIQCFNSRTNYSYVKGVEVNIKADQSMWIRNIAEQQITNGVRVWKVPVNPDLYDVPNPPIA